MKYNDILQPDLFDSRYAAEFVYDLANAEVDTSSSMYAQSIENEMLPTDDMPKYLDYISKTTQQEILNQISTNNDKAVININPAFYSFYNLARKPIIMSVDFPTRSDQSDEILLAGKALAIATCAHAVFFRSIVMHDDGKIITHRDEVGENYSYAIHIVGSTLRGNCLSQLININDKDGVSFEVIHNSITRDSEVNYKISKFYEVKDSKEMENILIKVRKLQLKIAGQDDMQSRILFATTLKALHLFGS